MRVFQGFFNCANGIKSRKASHIMNFNGGALRSYVAFTLKCQTFDRKRPDVSKNAVASTAVIILS